MQAAACRNRADQGLQLRGGGAFDQAAHQRCSVIQGASQARTARIARGQHGGGPPGSGPPLSPPLASGTGGVAAGGGGWANQAAQQKLNAQLTRTWWRRIAISERT